MSEDTLFSPPKRDGVRVVVTGQVGIDKKPYLKKLQQLAAQNNKPLHLCHVGDMMYAEAPDVKPGRILDLPMARLDSLRRSVFKDIVATCQQQANVVINTHATFRWQHGLFPAYDQDQMEAINADLYITLVDNVDAVHERLTREHSLRHDLKDIMVWREEESVVTKCMARSIRGHGCSYIFARGVERDTLSSLYRLIFEPTRKRVYPSFPMTHVMDMPDVLAEIDTFREALADHFITFDPGDLDEKRLPFYARDAIENGKDHFLLQIHGREVRFDAEEVERIEPDIDGQIYARDFELIDQSDMIVSYVPELPGGKPGLSSGVERELQHAFEVTKEVYVVWKPATEPSPFITETATRVFKSVEETLAFFQEQKYIGDVQLELPKVARAPSERGRFG
jgi:adenylate kinase